jgi:type IV secretory pathway VirD2 relaxase
VERDVEDGRAFIDRGRDDRHQFRFIVSAENGAELSDPRETTRNLLKQMETDLGTKLGWIAVDHHNTGHPHTHILVRGVTEDGKTLNIAGDYIAYGIRERASEIVTLELGRQTELEVTKQLEREMDADRREKQQGPRPANGNGSPNGVSLPESCGLHAQPRKKIAK